MNEAGTPNQLVAGKVVPQFEKAQNLRGYTVVPPSTSKNAGGRKQKSVHTTVNRSSLE